MIFNSLPFVVFFAAVLRPPDDNADLRAEPHAKVRPDSLVMPGLVSGC